MGQESAHFLIVEDDDLDVESITRGFRRLNIGNAITRAQNGYEALDMLRGSNGHEALPRPNIILLDLNIPRMNGIEFLEALRADATLANCPVYVLTTSDRRKDIESAFTYNICGYIVKPVKIDQMFQALSSINMSWNLCT